MSLHTDNPPLPIPIDDLGAPFETKIPSLKEKFYFHQLIKESAINKHYIIEDISNLSEQTTPIFYYLKQTKYHSYEEHRFAKRFYTRFYHYSQSPFAKTDIAKLHFIYHFENEANNYFELITIYEYGDSDRIDVENIESEQILRFMRNICLLLEEVQKHYNIAHGNVSLKNMILANNELKLASFKPILQTQESLYHSWKLDLARKYSAIRLDLYLVGLMWMRFIGVEVSKFNNYQSPLNKVLHISLNEVKSLTNIPRLDLLTKLIDVEEYPVLSIEGVITEFDEFFVMEEIRAKKESLHQEMNNTRGENLTSNSFSHANFNNLGDTNGKISNMDDSNDDSLIKISDSKVNNPFTKAYKDSDNDLSNRHDDHKKAPRDNHSHSHNTKNGEFVIQGGEYSLKPKESFGDLGSLKKDKNDHDSFTDVNFDTGDHPNLPQHNNPNKNGKLEERYSSLDPPKDSILRNTSTHNYDEHRKISFDDLESGKRISFRNPNLANLDMNLRESLQNHVKRESSRNIDLMQNSLYAKFNSHKQDEQNKADSIKERHDNSEKFRDSKANHHNDSNFSNSHKKGSQIKESKTNLSEKVSIKNSQASLKDRPSERESFKKNNSKIQERESLNKPTNKLSERESLKKSNLKQSEKESLKNPADRESLRKINERESLNKSSKTNNQPKDRESIQSKKSINKSEASHKPSVQGKNSMVSSEIQNKSFGNKNSISNQILSLRDSLREKESTDNHHIESKTMFNKKDMAEQSEEYGAHLNVHKSSMSRNKESMKEIKNSNPNHNNYDNKNPQSSYNDSNLRDSTKRSLTPNKNSNASLGSQFSERESRRGGLNHRLVEEALNKKLTTPKEIEPPQHSSNFTTEKENQSRHLRESDNNHYKYERDLSNSNDIKPRAYTENVPPHHNHNEKSHSPSPSRTNSSPNPFSNRIEEFDKEEVESDSRRSNSHSPNKIVDHQKSQYEDSKKLSENLLTSDIVDHSKNYNPNESHQPIQSSNSQNHLIVDPKLLRPSKSIEKSLKNLHQNDKKTFTNLDPIDIEKSPLRRKKLEEMRQAEANNSPINVIRSKIRDALKVELPEAKKLEIIEKVQKEHEDELQKNFYRSWKQKDKIVEKTEIQKLLDKNLEKNIKELSWQKLQERKSKEKSQRIKQRATDRVVDMRILEKEYAPIQLLTQQLQKANPNLSKTENVDKYHEDEISFNGNNESFNQPSSKSPSRYKNTTSEFEEITKNATRNFKLSPIHKRDKLFVYNHEHQVLNIPFRKVVENFQRPLHEEIAELKSQMQRTSSNSNIRSPKPVSRSPKKKLKHDISATGMLNTQSHDLQSYFFKNQSNADLKEKLNEIPVFDTLKPVRNLSNEKNKEVKDSIRNSLAGSLYEKAIELGNHHVLDKPINHEEFLAMNDHPDILVHEVQRYSIFNLRNVFALPEEVKKQFPDLEQDIQKIKRCFVEQRIQDCHIQADKSFKKHTGTNQIEILKVKAFLYFITNNFGKAKETLVEALQTLKQKNGLNHKDLYFAFLVINMAFLEFYCHDYEEAIKILKQEIFNDPAFRPSFYSAFLGNCHYFLSKFSEAGVCYAQQLKLELSNDPIDKSSITNIFCSISKILCCYIYQKKKVESARFYQSLEEPFKRFVIVSKGFDTDKLQHLKNLFEQLSLLFLKFGHNTHNGGLLNFVLQRSLEKKLIDPLNNLTEDEKVLFCSYILYVCNYLKSKPNYGNFKNNYSRYLDLGKKIISTCNLNVENLKINLSILFHKGMFCLQNGEIGKAKSLFDKCFKLYSTFFEGKNPELFDMIFKIGVAITKMKNFELAAFFFEKILALNCPSNETREEAQRQLGKIYFRLQRFAECVKTLKSYIQAVVFKYDIVTFGKSLFKEICTYFVANEKAKLKEFVFIKEILTRKLMFNPKIYVIRYLELFNVLSSVKFRTLSQSSRELILANLRQVLNDVKLDDEESVLKMIAFATTAYNSIIDEDQIDPEEKEVPLLQLLKDKDLLAGENAKIIHQFVFNFAFMITMLLPDNRNNPRDDQSKNNDIDNLLVIRSYKKSEEVVMDLIANTQPTSIESQAKKIQKMLKSVDAPQTNNLKPNGLKNRSNTENFELPLEMKKTIEIFDANRDFCKCSRNEEETYEVTTLIEQFLRHVKNMLFLEVVDNLGDYYRRFEAIIIEKNWNWNKFTYVRDLFNYYLSNTDERVVDKASFVKLLDSIFSNEDLCIHDLKLIVLLIESFKNVEYIQIFVRFIDRFHPVMAAVIFNLIFMKNFNDKRNYVVSSFYKKIYSYRFYHLENFPLMHCIGIENFLQIEKELDFKIYVRHRYDCMANPKYFDLFSKYIAPSALREFNLQYTFYNTIVMLIKKPTDKHYEILQNFQYQLAHCQEENELSKAKNLHYFYDIYLILNLIDLIELPKGADMIMQILRYIEDKLSQEQIFHFAVLCSLAGNYFCKFKFFDTSIASKYMALNAMKKLVPGPITFPSYVMEVDPKLVIFSVLSFLVVDYLELKQMDEAEIFLSKLLEYKFENGMLDLEKLLLNFWFEFHVGEYQQSIDTLELAQKLFDKMHLNEFLTKLFKATIDKMHYLVSHRIHHPDHAARKRESSNQSIAHLMNIKL